MITRPDAWIILELECLLAWPPRCTCDDPIPTGRSVSPCPEHAEDE